MATNSAVGLGAKLLMAIGFSELAIMLILQASGLSELLAPGERALLDALLLSAIAGALIWFWLVHPLRDALEMNAELASVVSNTSVGVLICDPDGPRKITFANHGFESLSGLKRGDVEGKSASGVLGIDVYNRFFRDIPHLGNQVTLEDCLVPLFGDMVVDITASPVIDADGTIVRIVLFISDVSDRYRKQVEMRRLLSAIEQSGEAVVITDKDGRVEYVNPAFSRMSGYSEEEMVGHSISKLTESGKRNEGDDLILNVVRSGGRWSGNLIKQHKDGSEQEEFTTISPVYDGKEITHYVIIQRDVSEEAELNKQLMQAQKLEAVGTLASGLAHDFNNSLTGILGNLYMLRKTINDKESLARIEAIERLGEHSTEIIKQLLTFSRSANDEANDFSLVSTVQECCSLIEAGVPGNVQVDIDAEPDAELPVHGNAGKIQQVIMNMVSNATYAIGDSESGRIHIALEPFKVDPDTTKGRNFLKKHDLGAGFELAHLVIEDNGSGMPKGVVEKIFSPFFTTKPHGVGTGLGLAMCYGIITAMKGMIDVKSREGRGTRFDIYLPLQSDMSAQLHSVETSTLMPGEGRTILVVDDHLSLRMINKDILESWGYTVLLAEDGNRAIDVFRERAADISVILMDITMPNLGGLAAARVIRKMQTDIPIIFITGHNDDHHKREVKAIKKAKLLAKPYPPQTLVSLIQEPFTT